MQDTARKQNTIIAIILMITFVATAFLFALMITKKNKATVVGSLDRKAAFKEFSEIEELKKNGLIYKDDGLEPLSDTPIESDTGLRAEAYEAYLQTNEIRAQAGLQPLSWSGDLEPCSAVRAVEAGEYFSHTRPNGKSWWTVNSDLMGGENLAYGYNSAGEVVEGWMNSPTHARNILHDRFRKIAITAFQAANGTIYWAQEFGY